MNKLVDIYFNLHKKKLSIRSRSKGRKVIAHKDAVIMKDCRFVVSEAGRQRVLRERRKNVHAVVRGEWVEDYSWDTMRYNGQNQIFPRHSLDDWQLVRYTPYMRETFWTVGDNKPIFKARFVMINGKDILALI